MMYLKRVENQNRLYVSHKVSESFTQEQGGHWDLLETKKSAQNFRKKKNRKSLHKIV